MDTSTVTGNIGRSGASGGIASVTQDVWTGPQGNGTQLGIAPSQPVVIRRSTIDNNLATQPQLAQPFTANNYFFSRFAGGISSTSALVQVDSSTLTANRFEWANGIGAEATTFASAIVSNGGVSIASSTISENTVTGTPGLTPGPGVQVPTTLGTAFVENSVIAMNGSPRSGFDDLQGAFSTASRFNFIGGGVFTGMTGGQNGNSVFPTDPGLDPLANYGGPTLTMRPSAVSLLTDAGVNSGSSIDQRYSPREVTRDIGAVELGTPVLYTTVTTTADEDNGTSDPAIGTGTSLREAVNSAISLASLAGIKPRISFSLGTSPQIINLNNALPNLPADVSISGPGSHLLTIRRNGAASYRVFNFVSGTSNEILGVTLADGSVAAGNRGGVLSNSSTLSLIDVVVRGGASSTDGGGIFNSGTLTLTNSRVENNDATTQGGGIYNTGTLNVNRSTLSGNDAQQGGAIANIGGTVNVNSSTMQSNTATNSGGGVYTTTLLYLNKASILSNSAPTGGGIFASGDFEIVDSTIANNTATSGSGAGLATTTPAPSSGGFEVTVDRSTFYGNNASANGGAIQSSAQLILTNVTLADNSAGGAGGGLFSANPGVVALRFVTVVDNESTSAGAVTLGANGALMENSIIARNTRPASSAPADALGAFLAGNSLIGNGSGVSGVTNGVNGMIVGVPVANLGLATLADNGGTVKTVAITTNLSPAFNSANNTSGILIDARGAVRPVNASDMGAYEFYSVINPGPLLQQLVVTTNVDEDDGSAFPGFGSGVSLREALHYASTKPGADTITFAPTVDGQTITLSRVDAGDADGGVVLFSYDTVTIQGPVTGVNIETSSSITGAQIIRAVADLTLKNVNLLSRAEVLSTPVIGIEGATLTLNNVNLSAESPDVAVGVVVEPDADAQIVDSTLSNFLFGVQAFGNVQASNSEFSGSYIGAIIDDNSVAAFDRALFVENGTALMVDGEADITASRFTGNSDTQSSVFPVTTGGAAINAAPGSVVNVSASTFDNNSRSSSSLGHGGAVQVADGATFTGTNVTFSSNTAAGFGGALANLGTTVLRYATIAYNNSGQGAALENLGTGPLTLINSVVANNLRGTTLADAGFNTVAFQPGSVNNVFGLGGSGGLSTPANGNISTNTPGIGVLANNGGPTPTIALLTGSPAINRASALAGVATDQRGTARPQGTSADSGAYERVPTVAVLTAQTFEFETREALNIDFDIDARTTLVRGDIQVTNLTTGQPVPTNAGTLTFNGTGLRATLTLTNLLPDGRYVAAPTLQNSTPFNFFVMHGDANRDARVDTADFSILASRFNMPGTFSQGDFNYDGVTNIGDFAILASKFNTSLPALRGWSNHLIGNVPAGGAPFEAVADDVLAG